MINLILIYVKNAFNGAVPIFFCWLIIRSLFLWITRKKLCVRREIMISLFAAYLIMLLEITVIRFNGIFELFSQISQPQTRVIQLVPIVKTMEELETALWAFLYPVLGNIAWFLPLGILLPYLFPKMVKCWKIALAGLSLSASIEILQWVFGTGISDIDDIIFNVCGSVLGYGCYRVMKAWIRKKKCKSV